MGKAIAVGITVVLIMAIVAFVILRAFREMNKVGDLTQKQEREMRFLLDDAALVMRSLGVSYHLNETDILSDRSRETVNDWLERYENYHQKEINA